MNPPTSLVRANSAPIVPRAERFLATGIFKDAQPRLAIEGMDCLLHDMSGSGVSGILGADTVTCAVGAPVAVTMVVDGFPLHAGRGEVARIEVTQIGRKIGVRLVDQGLDLGRIVANYERWLVRDDIAAASGRLAAAFDRAHDALREDRIGAGLAIVHEALVAAHASLSPVAWEHVRAEVRCHPIADALYQDPMTRQSFLKPRGYPGDAVLLDLIYGSGVEAEQLRDAATPLGRAIYRWNWATPAAQAVRWRRDVMASAIDAAAAARPPADILSIACGHLREADVATAVARGALGRFVVLDQDPETLASLRRRLALPLETIEASIYDLATGKVIIPGSFDLVYSTGLFDYLPDAAATRLIRRLWPLVRPGGRLLVANASRSNPQLGYLESFMDWMFVLRSAAELRRLVERSVGKAGELRCFEDEGGLIVFAELAKPA